MATSPPGFKSTLRTSSSVNVRLGALSIGGTRSSKSLPELQTQESVISLNVSSTKQTKVIEVYQFLLNQRILGNLSGSPGWMNEGAEALTEVASSTNTLVPCIICLFAAHFETGTVSPKSNNGSTDSNNNSVTSTKDDALKLFLKGESVASKIIENFFARIGCDYIVTVLGPSLTKVLDSNEWFEMESVPKADLKRSNDATENLLNCCRAILQSITSADSIFHMPEEMKCVLNVLFEFGCILQPTNKYVFVSNCLIRFFLSILFKPEKFFKGREITERVRKNFAAVSKVLQRLADGTEFAETESLKGCNNFIKVNKDRMEQYFKDVSYHPSSQDTTAVVLTPASVDYLADSFVNSSVLLSALIHDEKSLQEFQKMVSSMRTSKNFEEIMNYKPMKAKYKTKIKVTISLETEEGNLYDRVIEAPLSSLEAFIANSTTAVEKVIQEQQQTILIEGSVFAKPLEVFTKKSKTTHTPTNRTYIPSDYRPQLAFLYDMVDYLLLKGLTNRKIFDGATKENEVVAELRSLIDQGFDPMKFLIDSGKIINYSKYQVTDVAMLLKLFLYKLPDPLFRSSALSLMDLPPDVRREKIKAEITRLHPINRHIVQLLSWVFLQFHLSDPSTEIAMESITTNFGHCFATMEQKGEKGRSSMDTQSSRESKGLLRTLITEYETIFKDQIAADIAHYKHKPILRKRFVAHEESIVCLEPNFDAKMCFSCSSGGEQPLKIWDATDHVMTKAVDFPGILCMLQVSGSLWCGTQKGIYILSTLTLMCVEAVHTMHGASALCTYGNVVWANSLQNNSIFVFDIQSFGARWFIINPPQKDTAPPSVMETIDKYIWVGCNTCIFVWNVETHEIRKELKNAHTKKVRSFCGVGDTVWSCAEDCKVKIWSKQTFQVLKEVEAHNGRVKKLLRVPHTPIIWSCSSDMTVRLWHAQTGDLLEELSHFSDGVSDLVFTYNFTKKLWTAWVSSYDRTITVYEFTEESLTKAPPVWSRNMIRQYSSLLE